MRYETRELLAAAYRGKKAPTRHSHVLDTRNGVVLCGRVKPENLADVNASEEDAEATCPACSSKDPRNKTHAEDGPRALKHIFQF